VGVASEFNITSLKELAVLHCIESITSCVEDIKVNNFKDMLQLAHLYNAEDLKTEGLSICKEKCCKSLDKS
jgi:hypothetical protein